jgi:hypothetical protein
MTKPSLKRLLVVGGPAGGTALSTMWERTGAVQGIGCEFPGGMLQIPGMEGQLDQTGADF